MVSGKNLSPENDWDQGFGHDAPFSSFVRWIDVFRCFCDLLIICGVVSLANVSRREKAPTKRIRARERKSQREKALVDMQTKQGLDVHADVCCS